MERLWMCSTVANGENLSFSGCEMANETEEFMKGNKYPLAQALPRVEGMLASSEDYAPIAVSALAPSWLAATKHTVWDEHPLSICSSLCRYTLSLTGSTFQLPQFSKLI